MTESLALFQLEMTEVPIVGRTVRSPGASGRDPAEVEEILARGFAVIDHLHAQNADRDPDRIDRDVAAAVVAVREEMNAERRRPARASGR